MFINDSNWLHKENSKNKDVQITMLKPKAVIRNKKVKLQQGVQKKSNEVFKIIKV